MPHCQRHHIYNPNCHDCREASLTHTSSLLDDDQPSAASILLTQDDTIDTSLPSFDTTLSSDPVPDSSPFDGGSSGGGGTSGDF